jgi:hypothetical protein
MKRLSLATVLCVSVFSVHATPIIANGPYQFLDNRTSNDAGVTPGVVMQFGVRSVTPNSDGGTTGIATNGSNSIALNNQTYSVNPNFFSRGLICPGGVCDATAFDPWTITLTNGGDTKVLSTPGVDSTLTPLPFVSNVKLDTSGTTPILSWSSPTGVAFDTVILRVRDNLTGVGPAGPGCNPLGSTGGNCVADLIYQEYLPASANSFALSGGLYAPGGLYSLEIALADLRGIYIPGGSIGAMFEDIQNQSRAYFNYSILGAGAPPDVYLPTPSINLDGTPSYSFNITNVGGDTIFIDPLIAIGYDYAVGDGDPFFKTVVLPSGIGDDVYEIIVGDVSYIVNAGEVFDFTKYILAGVEAFRVMGIEISAGLDPFDATAFVTGLSFVGTGNFTGTMTPVIVRVSEPATIALLGGGMFLLMWLRRGRPANKRSTCPLDTPVAA